MEIGRFILAIGLTLTGGFAWAQPSSNAGPQNRMPAPVPGPPPPVQFTAASGTQVRLIPTSQQPVAPRELQLPPPHQAGAPESLPPGSSAPIAFQGLTLLDLENMALNTSPALARSAALVQAARGNWVQVGLKPNPTVGYDGQQIGSQGKAEQDGVFVSQEFVRGGKLRLNRQVAAQEIVQAERELAAQRERVLTDVRVAYFSVLVAQRQEILGNELASIAQRGYQAAETLLKSSEVGKIDVVQAQLELENAQILRQNAVNRRRAAWQGLAAVVGQPMLPLQLLLGSLDEPIPEYRWDDVIFRLLSTSPELAAASANVERARWAVQRARVEKTPNVSVTGLFNVRDEGIGGKPDGAVTVGIPLPLFDRNQGGVSRAQGEAIAAERAVQQLELNLQQRLAPVFERYVNARNQVDRYRAVILPGAKQALDMTRQAYEGGEIGFIVVLTAQRTYSQTNLNYLTALQELRASSAEIDGLLLSGSLQAR